MLLAHDNTEKIDSRELIVQAIKKHLPGEEIKMFELLGAGIGAKYYDSKLPMKHIALIEKDTMMYNAFSLDNLASQALKFRSTAYKFFDKFPVNPQVYSRHFFNVTNLDFNGWIYDNGKSNSTVQIINKMFASQAVKPGGLAFFTFMTWGRTLDCWRIRHKKVAVIDPAEISIKIGEIASNNGYTLDIRNPILLNPYRSRKEGKSGRGYHMLNLGFKIAA